MAKDQTQLAEMTADDSQGWLSHILADEEEWDARSLWKLGSWAGSAIAALVVAFIAAHAADGARRDQVAAADLMRQAQQIQWVAKEGQTETRRLSSALETLNADRDRLFARVTVLEQGLDSVTGSVARQGQPASLVLSSASQPLVMQPPAIAPVAATAPSESAASDAPAAAPAAAVQMAAVTPPRDPLATTTIYAPPDPGAPKLIEARPPAPAAAVKPEPAKPEPAKAEIAKPDAADRKPAPAVTAALAPATPPAPPPVPPVVAAGPSAAPAEMTVLRTDFGVDLGAANSVDGLRALWRGLVKADSELLAPLRPIMVVRERAGGLGLQLRLVAGPIGDAAAAARICAALAENSRACETTVYDGQRLSMKAEFRDEPRAAATPAPKPPRRPAPTRSRRSERAPPPRVAARPAEPAAQVAQAAPAPAASESFLPGIFRR